MAGPVAASIAISVRSLKLRFWPSLTTVVTVALVIAVLLGFEAMSNGFRGTVANGASADVAIAMDAGAEKEINSAIGRQAIAAVEAAPGIVAVGGRPMASEELYVVVSAPERLGANLALRGMGPFGPALRARFRLTAGRMFRSGVNELIVGRQLARSFPALGLGRSVIFGRSSWTIVGIFDTGAVTGSEMWGDIDTVRSAFARPDIAQSIRLRLEPSHGLVALQDYLRRNARLNLKAQSETDYYRALSTRTSDVILYLGWPLAICMALGAVAGALSTTYNSVAVRSVEIATLRAIGFSGFSAFAGVLVESLTLAAIGGLAGTLLIYATVDGLSAATIGSGFTTQIFTFRLSATAVAEAIAFALALGLLGGLFPALHAARISIARGLNS